MEEDIVNTETAVHDTENSLGHADDLLSTFATAEIPPDISHTPRREISMNTTEQELEEISESSSSSRRQSATTGGYMDDVLEEDGHMGAKSASSRSSLSSIPDSVVVNPKQQVFYGRESSSTGYGDHDFMNYGSPVYQKIRDRNSPFRHPSSVKAIQMQTEDEEYEDYKSPSRRRGPGYIGSPASARSLGSPLLRRQGHHSAGGTPKKSSVKRENPLVLLHCTILPPTVVLAPGVNLPERKILEKLLPLEYWRRWKLLEEKIIGSGLLRDRGLLIQHPQEDYGLLEERVLESLELQRPRLQNGHFVDRDTSDSETEATEEAPILGNKVADISCADCGCHVTRHKDQQKWDVKFYAANGLMKEGAWTAAWKEIERVDVQVSLWLPDEVKSEVERRIQEEGILVAEQEQVEIQPKQSVSEPETKDQKCLSQDQIDGLDDDLAPQKKSPHRKPSGLAYPAVERAGNRKTKKEADLHTLVINSLRVLASDRRNIVTAVSMLIAIFAVIFGGRQSRRTPYASNVVQFDDFPAVSTQVYYTSSTSVLTQKSTEIPLPETGNGMERLSEIQRVAQGVREDGSVNKSDTSGVHDMMRSVSASVSAHQQQVEPAVEMAESTSIQDSPSNEQSGILDKAIVTEQAIPEPTTQPVQAPPPSVPGPHLVEHTSSLETDLYAKSALGEHLATCHNDDDDAAA